jgi:murein DD-endopeptidase MepM/ murein hydrolase activator NlpD
MSWGITGPVGRQQEGATNVKSDVRTVQHLLTRVAAQLGDPQLDPKGEDGLLAASPSSDTLKAILAFQARFMVHADGLISVNGETWGRLQDAAEGVTAGQINPNAGGGPFFPFPALPPTDWTHTPRSFGANRTGPHGSQRAHAGCDLYFPQGTWMYAIADGVVVQGPYPFYQQTFALEIDHGTFLARYGEVQSHTAVRKNDPVKAGQKIARVGHLVGITVPSDMLHLEIYDKTATGSLTVVDAAHSKKRSDGVPFLRRKDLTDPTSRLNQWKMHLPKAY